VNVIAMNRIERQDANAFDALISLSCKRRYQQNRRNDRHRPEEFPEH
jgi:hypothetical protein